MRSRSSNVKRNFSYSIMSQGIGLLLSFASRTVFLKCLPIEYAGVTGLFNGVLNILSLAELGLGSTAIYSLYKPIADKDTNKIRALIRFFRVLYFTIGISTIVIGALIYPFLGMLVDVDSNIPGLMGYYWIFILNLSASYFSTYKLIYLRAKQQEYVLTVCSTLSNIAVNVLQIVVLILFRNYLYYLILILFNTICSNLFAVLSANRRYPFLKEKSKDKLSKEEARKIYKTMYGMFLYQLGSIITENSRYIIISSILGLAAMGLYSNYQMIVGIARGLIKSLYNAVYSSIGDVNVRESKEKKENIFQTYVYVFSFLAAVAVTGFYCLMNYFVQLWIGKQYLLSQTVVLALCIDLYITVQHYPIENFRNTSESFMNTKYLACFTAVLSIIGGIYGGSRYGLGGIIIVGAAANFLTLIVGDAINLYYSIFSKSFYSYVKKQLRYIVIISVCIIINSKVISIFEPGNLFIWILDGCLVVVITSLIWVAANFASEEQRYIYQLLKKKRS